MYENIVEAIKDGQIIKVPEHVAREEDLFILRRADKNSWNAGEDRAEDSFMREGKKQKGISIITSTPIRADYMKNNVLHDLKKNFQWDIVRARRERGMTRKQLADNLGISEAEMKLVEYGGLPSDDFILVNKIESYLKVEIKKKKQESPKLSDLQKLNEDVHKSDRNDYGKSGKSKVPQKDRVGTANEESLFSDSEIEIVD